MPAPQDFATFELGDLTLQGGATLRRAHLAYKTYGTLNSDGTNAVLVPTWYSSRHDQNEWMIGSDKALDPETFFILSVNMLGNGVCRVAEQHATAVRPWSIPVHHVLRPGGGAARTAHSRSGVTSLELVTGSSMGAAGPPPR